jgi:hypothetical protein
MTNEVLADRRKRGKLALCLLQVALAEIGEPRLDRRRDRFDGLPLTDADERNAGRIAPPAPSLIADCMPQRRIAAGDAVVAFDSAQDELRAGWTVDGPTSVRGPGRVAQ